MVLDRPPDPGRRQHRLPRLLESVNGNEPGLTFEPANPLSAVDEPGLDRGRRIDYLLVRCGDHGPTLRIADCRRVFDEPVDGVMASDHYGVLADLEATTP